MTRSDTTSTRELDVRDIDEPPFEPIMGALSDLGPDETLVIINEFEPEPLYGVLEDRGFTHRAEQVADDEWRVSVDRA